MSGAGAPWSRALAPAKVNPWLAVLGRRPDGYHELDTGLLALDLCDEVRARRRERGAGDWEDGVRLALGGPALTPDVPADGRNLAWRAAAAVLAEARAEGLSAPDAELELELTKRIPSRAGLGGGSADAVAAALAARAALGLAPAWSGLAPLAAALGSDTAFFAQAPGGWARCTGRGERVEPLPAPRPGRLAVALVAPALEAPTAAVYAAFDSRLPRAARAPTFPSSFLEGPVDSVRALLFNDLEAAALATLPGLSAWRDLLDRCGAAHFRLSGSGSTFFGLFDGAPSASRCLAEIRSLARARNLALRGAWVTRPAGHGARLCASDVSGPGTGG